MYECGIWRKVLFDGLLLDRRRGLSEQPDDFTDLFDCTIGQFPMATRFKEDAWTDQDYPYQLICMSTVLLSSACLVLVEVHSL